jgi:hypothetical protein
MGRRGLSGEFQPLPAIKRTPSSFEELCMCLLADISDALDSRPNAYGHGPVF